MVRHTTRRVSRRKARGGAPQRVKLVLSWSVGDSGNFLGYAKKKGADLADLVDDIELHVKSAGYDYATVPLRNQQAEKPITLNAAYGTWKGTGAPPTPDPLTITDPEATATFSVSAANDEGQYASGGKSRKTRGRRRA